MTRRIAAILLAAGAARRFGGNKLVARLPDGTAVGLAAARRLAGAVTTLRVVVAPDADETRALFEPAFAVTVCPDATSGIGHSLAHGVAASADADGWLIALADMPHVASATIAAVLDALDLPSRIVRPAHAGRAGHPVGFGRDYFDELVALTGDAGAASVIARHPAHLTTVDVDDPGCLIDIDRPGDLDQPVR